MNPLECRRRREALGLTPKQLSELAGLDERTVGRFEACATTARHGTKIAILRALRTAEALSPPEPAVAG
ncbi:MAG TPA: hypothetical protein VJP88_06420 [Caulobacteraceae bacterium]|nr:hypothetical protein [Caulobacteraceae bacterium]